MPKLIVIWSNGDKDKFEISDQYAEDFIKNPPYKKSPFRDWTVFLGTIGINMEHARKVWIEKS